MIKSSIQDITCILTGNDALVVIDDFMFGLVEAPSAKFLKDKILCLCLFVFARKHNDISSDALLAHFDMRISNLPFDND